MWGRKKNTDRGRTPSSPEDWARIAAILSKNFGWGLEEIKRLTFDQLALILDALGEINRDELAKEVLLKGGKEPPPYRRLHGPKAVKKEENDEALNLFLGK